MGGSPKNLANLRISRDNNFVDLLCLKVPQWEKREGLLHGFLGRPGGKSAGPYASLNLSFRVGDDPQSVKDNLCDMKKDVGMHDLTIVTMRQVHGDRIVEINDNRLKEAGEADGMVTEKRGLFLGVLTADCVPILFSVRRRKLVAAVHAGWRGTLAGIASKMVRYLKDRHDVNPALVEAALGPAIDPCCYEIGSDVAVPLVQRWGSLAENSLQSRDGRRFLDLRELNRRLLEDAGVPAEQIFKVGPCTACAAEDFFSYRRQKGKTGHQMGFIGWL